MGWAAERGVTLTPQDMGERLIDGARHRLPDYAENFAAAEAWGWAPSRRYRYVYSLGDLAPSHLLGVWVERLLAWVEPGGLILGSSSRGRPPREVAGLLAGLGYPVAGSATGGEPPVTSFGWIAVP
ncbi:MAG: hypothetical protein ACRDVM_01080 [Acidimicrobiia bacterium]